MSVDAEIRQAERVVLSTYGDTVSVAAKGKNLNKFGRTSTNVGTTFATVAEFQDAVTDETFVTTNIIDSIVSTSGSDTTQTITIEGHTIDGSGNLTFVSQNASLNGQTEVTLSTPLARATRAFVANSGAFGTTPAALVGDVAIYDNTGGITSGKPNTDAAVKLMVLAGRTQSEKCATAISSTDYWFVTGFSAQVFDAAPTTDYVTFRMEIRDIANGGAWRPLGAEVVAEPSIYPAPPLPFSPYRIVPKNHDWRIMAKTDAGTAPVIAEAEGFLAAIQ